MSHILTPFLRMTHLQIFYKELCRHYFYTQNIFFSKLIQNYLKQKKKIGIYLRGFKKSSLGLHFHAQNGLTRTFDVYLAQAQDEQNFCSWKTNTR